MPIRRPAAPRPSQFLTAAAVAQLQHLDLIARGVVEGFLSGRHRGAHPGFSVEFAHHRAYAPGDDPRHVDWRVWARTDRFSLKQYEAETHLRVHVLVDVSASMEYGSGTVSKRQYACYLAASLAYLALRQNDPTGLVLLDDSVRRFLPPRTGPAALRRILTELETLPSPGPTGLRAGLRAVAERVKRRGLVVLVSDLLDQPEDVLQGLAWFRHKKHEVLVLQVLDPAERAFPFAGPSAFRDPETGRTVTGDAADLRRRYLREIDHLLETYQKQFAAHGIDYALLDTSTPFATALARFLDHRSRHG